MTQTILILGSSGRCGRHASDAFNVAGWTVRRFDRAHDDLDTAMSGVDVVLNAGTGIMDPPGGPADGVRAFFLALEHHAPGAPFTVDDVPEGPLAVALRTWGVA